MKIQVVGSNGSLGQVVVPILKDFGFYVSSVGRHHHRFADSKIDWTMGEDYPIDQTIDYIIYCPLDYSRIKFYNQFISENTKPLLDLIRASNRRSKIILPLSFSGVLNSNSRYGKLKYLHQELAFTFGLQTLLVGWLNNPGNGGEMVQKVFAVLRSINLNILPFGGNQEIFVSERKDLERAILKLFEGEANTCAIPSFSINLVDLVYSQKPKNTFFLGNFVRQLLRIVPAFYLILPSRLVKAIDSARSLI